MKRINDLYDKIYSLDNLYKAYLLARKLKRYRCEVLEFEKDLALNLKILQNQLITKTYTTGKYKKFKVYEPKERTIMALPFKDRVVQHAVNNIIEEYITNRLYRHTYACVKGRGVHAASFTVRKWLKDCSCDAYCLKCDIKKYFPSINKDTLYKQVSDIIKCEDTLWLLGNIIYSNPDSGIPIGNLTSQILANLYLTKLDNFLRFHYGIERYIRYMDDFVLIGYDKEYLREILFSIELFIESELNLSLNNKTKLSPIFGGINFVGYVHYKDKVMVRRSTFIRLKNKMRVLNCENKMSIPGSMGMLKYISNIHLYRYFWEKVH